MRLVPCVLRQELGSTNGGTRFQCGPSVSRFIIYSFYQFLLVASISIYTFNCLKYGIICYYPVHSEFWCSLYRFTQFRCRLRLKIESYSYMLYIYSQLNLKMTPQNVHDHEWKNIHFVSLLPIHFLFRNDTKKQMLFSIIWLCSLRACAPYKLRDKKYTQINTNVCKF